MTSKLKVLKVSNEVLTAQIRQVLRSGRNISFDENSSAYTVINTSADPAPPISLDSPSLHDIITVINNQGDMGNALLRDLLVSTDPSLLAVSLDTNTRLTNIGITNNVIKLYDNSKTYPASTAPVCMDKCGLLYSTDSVGVLKCSSLAIDNSRFTLFGIDDLVGVNVDALPIHMSRTANTPVITLVPTDANNPPTRVNGGVVNGQQKSRLRCTSGRALSSAANSTLAQEGDFTLFVAFKYSTEDYATVHPVIAFSGNADVYGVSLSINAERPASATKTLLNIFCGELHSVPDIPLTQNDVSVYVVRLTGAYSLLSVLDVFCNGTKIYSKQLSIDLNDKNFGLSGIIELGSATALPVCELDFAHISWTNYALSDQECCLNSQRICVENAISDNVLESSLTNVDWFVRYLSAHGSGQAWNISNSPINVFSNVSVFNMTQPQINLAPQFDSNATEYHRNFFNGIEWMQTDILSNSEFLYDRFSVVFAFRAVSAGSSVNEVCKLSLAGLDSQQIVVSAFGDSTNLLFSLATPDNSSHTFQMKNVSNNNNFLLAVSVCNSTYSLVAIRLNSSTLDVNSCSGDYNDGINEFQYCSRIIIGRTQAVTNIYEYSIGDVMCYSRSLSAHDLITLAKTF